MEKIIKINGKNNIIKIGDINSFRSQYGGGRGQNDGKNKIREKLTYAIIFDMIEITNEKNIPEEWYVYEETWRIINKGIYEYITKYT